jgi:hypothetical protein
MESALARIDLCSLAPPVQGVSGLREDGNAFVGKSGAHAEGGPATSFLDSHQDRLVVTARTSAAPWRVSPTRWRVLLMTSTAGRPRFVATGTGRRYGATRA